MQSAYRLPYDGLLRSGRVKLLLSDCGWSKPRQETGCPVGKPCSHREKRRKKRTRP